MKSATNDRPRKVAGEADVGLRERPYAAVQDQQHAAVRLPQTGHSDFS